MIAYEALRAIEAEINRRRGEPDRRSDIPLTNFRAIDLRDFLAEIARLALVIAEYQCDTAPSLGELELSHSVDESAVAVRQEVEVDLAFWHARLEQPVDESGGPRWRAP